jgi:hypothetical protein
MTAQEIQHSGIDTASTFRMILKDGNHIDFRSDVPRTHFFTFHFESNNLSAYKYYDAKGLHDAHIAINAENICRIEVLRTTAEHQVDYDRANLIMRMVLVILIFIGAVMALIKHRF